MRSPLALLSLAVACVACTGGTSSVRPAMLADRAPPVPVVHRGGVLDDDASSPPPLSRAPRNLELPSELRLANGVRILLVERHALPLVSASFLVQFDPNKASTVVPHLYAEAMLGGSAGHSADSTAILLGAAGVRPSSFCAADTLVLAATMLAPHANEVLDRLSETVAAPTFESRAIERGQRALIAQRQQLRKYPSAGYAVDRMLLGEAHPARARAFEDVHIRATSRDDLVAFEHAYLSADNLTVAIVGDFRRADVLRVLESRLGRLRTTSTPRTAWHEPPPPERARIAIVPWRGGTQSKIAVAFTGPSPRSEDRAALALVAELLGAFSGRLRQKLRQEQGATYGVHAGEQWWRTGGALEISTSVETGHTVATVDAIVREVARLAAERVPDDELSRAKGRVLSRAQSSAGFMKNLHELQMIASQDLPLDHFVRYASQLDSLTAEDVRTVAAKVLRTDRMQIAVAADPAAVEAPLRALDVGDVSIAPPP